MEQTDLLELAVQILERLGIRYALVGSFASGIWGESEGGSDKHLRDIAGILRISGDFVDREYIGRFAKQLGVEDEWQVVVARVDQT